MSWEWIREQMVNCPRCNQKPSLGTDVVTKKYQVACMNACCGNMYSTTNSYWGRAIVEWNRH